MLSPKAITYALVDLFEFQAIQLADATDARQIMEHAGVPCVLVAEGDMWSVRLAGDVPARRLMPTAGDEGPGLMEGAA